eukprot:TRINITY_DN6918_c0_g1_i1.p1 TRINITY_DN6918_c0_g1~~TRINITY_DN6918_c0_g1_i1.p1  ORF type:complete len:154 (+),score=18.43 TRINITY_DN6918_c0_g1_i1:31-492(+)
MERNRGKEQVLTVSDTEEVEDRQESIAWGQSQSQQSQNAFEDRQESIAWGQSQSQQSQNAFEGDINTILNLTTRVDPAQQKNCAQYHLQSVVEHFGQASAGHYVSNVYDGWTKEWKLFNDSKVTSVRPYNIKNMTKSAYILFYVHDSCWTLPK